MTGVTCQVLKGYQNFLQVLCIGVKGACDVPAGNSQGQKNQVLVLRVHRLSRQRVITSS